MQFIQRFWLFKSVLRGKGDSFNLQLPTKWIHFLLYREFLFRIFEDLFQIFCDITISSNMYIRHVVYNKLKEGKCAENFYFKLLF